MHCPCLPQCCKLTQHWHLESAVAYLSRNFLFNQLWSLCILTFVFWLYSFVSSHFLLVAWCKLFGILHQENMHDTIAPLQYQKKWLLLRGTFQNELLKLKFWHRPLALFPFQLILIVPSCLQLTTTSLPLTIKAGGLTSKAPQGDSHHIPHTLNEPSRACIL